MKFPVHVARVYNFPKQRKSNKYQLSRRIISSENGSFPNLLKVAISVPSLHIAYSYLFSNIISILSYLLDLVHDSHCRTELTTKPIYFENRRFCLGNIVIKALVIIQVALVSNNTWSRTFSLINLRFDNIIIDLKQLLALAASS